MNIYLNDVDSFINSPSLCGSVPHTREKYVTIPSKLCTHQKPFYAQRFLSDFEIEHTIFASLQKALHPTVFAFRKDQITMNIYNRLENDVLLCDLHSAIRNCIDSETSLNNCRFSPTYLSQFDLDVIVLDADSDGVKDHNHVGGSYRGYGTVVIYCGISTLVEDSTPNDDLLNLAYKCKYIHKLNKKENKNVKKCKTSKKSKKKSHLPVQNFDFVNESELNTLFEEVNEIAFDAAAVEIISKKMSDVSSKSRYYDALSQLKAKVQLGIVTGIKEQMDELEAKYGKAYDTYKTRSDFLTREILAPMPTDFSNSTYSVMSSKLPDEESEDLFCDENGEVFF